MARRRRLRQIAGNLVTNACTHTPSAPTCGSGWARSSTRPGGNGHCWRCRRRAGPVHAGVRAGLSSASYAAARLVTQPQHRGSGLGLSIVAALVAAHGGT